jgi:trehalose 6-phosphate phosphatase
MRTLGAGDLGVRVGPGETAASVTVADIPALADLLALLAQMRGARPE